MQSLNLINPSKSTIKYETLVFSDSQPHIKIGVTKPVDTEIVTRISSANDLLLLLEATEVLRQNGVRNISVLITYLLGARMDRRMNPGEPITLKVIANILNSQNYEQIRIFDPHSPVTTTLIDRSESIDQLDFIREIINPSVNDLWLVSPDAGAAKKTEKLGKDLLLPVLYCTKSRDPKTGQMSNVKVEDVLIGDADCLIVDDICDGGRTFLNLVEPLKSKGVRSIYLAISHGIFSQGLEPLQVFSGIFTTNSFKERTNDRNLTVINLW